MTVEAHEAQPPAPPDRLLTTTSVVGFMTLMSRVTGLARDIAFSSWFGSGIVMDAFTVAFKIPNLLRRFFAEGAFSQAFVPVISEYRTHRSPAATRELVDRVAGTLGLALFVVTLVGVIAAPLLILGFAPGFRGGDGRYPLAVDMLRLTFPYVLFVSLTALAGSILNAYRRFAVAAFTPVLLNVVMILFAGWVEPRLGRPGLGLAAGVFAAGVVQLAFQVPFLRSLGMLPRPRWDAAHEGVRRIGKLMLPAIFGSSVAQISILLDTLIASFLAAGSISWLYFSDRLVEFPLGVFGIALATVILPRLSEHHATAVEGDVLRHARLGAEARARDRRAGGARARGARGAADDDAVPSRRVHGARRRDVGRQLARLRAGTARLHPGEGAGAGLLRAAGHADARSRRRPGAAARAWP